jgi:hypothetical protein
MRIPSLFIIAIAISQMGATDCGNAISDTGFDLWCGDQMCDWKIERGDVSRVATWSKGDPGAELVGDDVAIEQFSPVDSTDGSCLEFDLLADVSIDAHVSLNVDVFGDGTIEHTESIPTSNWTPLAFKLPINGVYRGIRFEIAKTGPGRAVLAQIGAKVTTGPGCDDASSAITPAPAPLGSPCSENSGCASSMCMLNECVGCTDGSCPTDQTCGFGDPTSPLRQLPLICVADNARELGEQCGHDIECASNICVGTTFYGPGNCSACRGASDCASCATTWADAPTPGHAPQVCGAGSHAQPTAAPCGSDDDCASGVCNGTVRMQCIDGRECVNDTNCPYDGLAHTTCSQVGIQGGSCQ